MLLLDLRNSNQPTMQGGWRYTPCGNKICSRTYIEYAGTCPIPISSGIGRTPRMRSFPMLMPRRLDHCARPAYMVTSTDRHRIHRLRSGCICMWSHISSRFQVLRCDERWRKLDDLLQLYKESGSKGYCQCVHQVVGL